MQKQNKNISLFKGKKIRKTIYNNEWWFFINDVIEALTDSSDPAQYFKRMKSRDEELRKLAEKGEVQFVPSLRLDILILWAASKRCIVGILKVFSA